MNVRISGCAELYCLKALGSLLELAVRNSKKACGVGAAKTGASIIALRHSCPSMLVIRMPSPRTCAIGSGVLGSGPAILNRPTTGYWPRSNSFALDSSEPSPFASNVPVKQIPFAWFLRWPNAGPFGDCSAATSLVGVNLCGVSHPAVKAKAIAATVIVTPIITTDLSGEGFGESAMPTSFKFAHINRHQSAVPLASLQWFGAIS